MRRATASALLVLASLVLSGCFTAMANSRGWRYEQAAQDKWGQNPSAWEPLSEARRLSCPMRCGGASPVWSLPGPGDSLFLSLPSATGGWDPAILSDRAERCADPAPPGAPPLELVVSPGPIPLAPASRGGIPTRAILVLRLGRDRSRSDTSLGPTKNSSLFYEYDGIRHLVRFEPDFAGMRERNATRARSKEKIWWLVSVPLDVVTSPIQLAVAIVAAPFFLIMLIGLGGHPW